MDDERERLIVEQIPHLRRYALALLGDRSAADDLVQDCLERAWSRLTLWRRGSSMRPWLFTIMHNLFINGSGRRRRAAGLLPLDEDTPQPATGGGQEERVELADMAKAITLLPPDQRAALLLVAVEEMSYQEAATVLGVPAGTVMSRLHRARERLAGLRSGGPLQPALRRIK